MAYEASWVQNHQKWDFPLKYAPLPPYSTPAIPSPSAAAFEPRLSVGAWLLCGIVRKLREESLLRRSSQTAVAGGKKTYLAEDLGGLRLEERVKLGLGSGGPL